jgi:hypothetical protein
MVRIIIFADDPNPLKITPSPSKPLDALVLEKEFHPEFTAHDLVNLPNYHIYLKLMIDGVVSKASSAATLSATKF